MPEAEQAQDETPETGVAPLTEPHGRNLACSGVPDGSSTIGAACAAGSALARPKRRWSRGSRRRDRPSQAWRHASQRRSGGSAVLAVGGHGILRAPATSLKSRLAPADYQVPEQTLRVQPHHLVPALCLFPVIIQLLAERCRPQPVNIVFRGGFHNSRASPPATRDLQAGRLRRRYGWRRCRTAGQANSTASISGNRLLRPRQAARTFSDIARLRRMCALKYHTRARESPERRKPTRATARANGRSILPGGASIQEPRSPPRGDDGRVEEGDSRDHLPADLGSALLVVDVEGGVFRPSRVSGT
jgi:hypothetical protein